MVGKKGFARYWLRTGAGLCSGVKVRNTDFDLVMKESHSNVIEE